MSGVKVVPVEPTPQMMMAGGDTVKGSGLYVVEIADIYRAMLAAAPDVQGEPVGHDWDDQDKCRHCGDRDWYASATCTPKQQPAPSAPNPTFQLGDHVHKTKGSQWKGRVVGTYSTSLTPEGYAVESDTEKGSVQIYPVGALELVGERPPC